MVAFRRQSNIWSLIFDKRLFSPFQNDSNGLRTQKILLYFWSLIFDKRLFSPFQNDSNGLRILLFCSKNNEIQDLTKILSWCGI